MSKLIRRSRIRTRIPAFRKLPLPFDSLDDNVVLSKNSIYNPFGTDFGGNSGANPDFTLRTFLFGQRESDTTEDGSDFNGGVRGNLFDTGWKWDLNSTYSRLQEHANISGYYYASKLNAAVGPSFLLNGVPTCGTGPTAIVSNCTPINLFNQFLNPPSALSGLSANYNTDYDIPTRPWTWTSTARYGRCRRAICRPRSASNTTTDAVIRSPIKSCKACRPCT